MTAVLELDRKLDTRAAPALVGQLLQLRGADVTLDATATSQIGTLALQALMVAAASWAKSGKVLTVIGLSDDILHQIERFGVDPLTFAAKETA